MSREPNHLQKFLKRVGLELRGVRCTWIDEFVGETDGDGDSTIFFGVIASDRLRYNVYDGDDEFKYHRTFDCFEPDEKLVSFGIKRTLVGPVVLIHTRLCE